ncbi:MAG: isoprenylcysteine carboxylmethyltransferase family protein [Deltaproteobacteria bacterium]|nr:isoprenylcysteine carboxylmethyltransferase family protein [Deltaproteobacteria bacterium]
MLLKDMIESQGKWLFKRRGYIPLVFVPVLLTSLTKFEYPGGLHKYDLLWEMFTLSISLFGLVIRAYTIGYAPSGTSGRHTKKQRATTLNTKGMYSVTRNPLYLGNFFAMLGVAMFPRLWWIVVLYMAGFWLHYERVIAYEEDFLKEKFGEEYEEYCRKTPVFIPKFNLWKSPDTSFSFRRVLRKEYSSLFCLILAFLCMEMISDYMVSRKIVFDPVWSVIFVITLILTGIIKVLKKYGKLLTEAG